MFAVGGLTDPLKLPNKIEKIVVVKKPSLFRGLSLLAARPRSPLEVIWCR